MWLLGLRQETTGSKNRRARTTFRPGIQGEPKISVSPKSERTRLASRGRQVGEGATRGHQRREVALLRDAASPMHPRPNSSCRGKGGAAKCSTRRAVQARAEEGEALGLDEEKLRERAGRRHLAERDRDAAAGCELGLCRAQTAPTPRTLDTHSTAPHTHPRHHRLWPLGALPPPARPRWLVAFCVALAATSRVFRKFFDGRTD